MISKYWRLARTLHQLPSYTVLGQSVSPWQRPSGEILASAQCTRSDGLLLASVMNMDTVHTTGYYEWGFIGNNRGQ